MEDTAYLMKLLNPNCEAVRQNIIHFSVRFLWRKGNDPRKKKQLILLLSVTVLLKTLRNRKLNMNHAVLTALLTV
jgi:hypothetical protein